MAKELRPFNVIDLALMNPGDVVCFMKKFASIYVSEETHRDISIVRTLIFQKQEKGSLYFTAADGSFCEDGEIEEYLGQLYANFSDDPNLTTTKVGSEYILLNEEPL